MEIKKLAKNFKIRSLSESKEFASFVFTNLPNEFSVTLGNYLRRILLSYIGGIAIFAVKIGNDSEIIKSEFISLKGMIETPPYLILNLKNLVLKSTKDLSFDEKVFKLSIEINNQSDDEYKVTGKDIKREEELIEVLNPDCYLATVSPNSNLKIDLYCKNSWGFRKDIEQKIIEKEEDLIVIDSDYNSVKNVSFRVNTVVVDLDSQEEQLVLDIKTNGSITPRQALINSLNISEIINKSLLEKL